MSQRFCCGDGDGVNPVGCGDSRCSSSGYDCEDVCGDGVCQPYIGEDCLSCPADCRGSQTGPVSQRYCCGDGAGVNPVGCHNYRCESNGFDCDSHPDDDDNERLQSVQFDTSDNCSDVAASAVIETECGTIPVAHGQLIEVKCRHDHDDDDHDRSGGPSRGRGYRHDDDDPCDDDDDDHDDYDRAGGKSANTDLQHDHDDDDDGILNIRASRATLIVTAGDECGNEATCVIEICTDDDDDDDAVAKEFSDVYDGDGDDEPEPTKKKKAAAAEPVKKKKR